MFVDIFTTKFGVKVTGNDWTLDVSDHFTSDVNGDHSILGGIKKQILVVFF